MNHAQFPESSMIRAYIVNSLSLSRTHCVQNCIQSMLAAASWPSRQLVRWKLHFVLVFLAALPASINAQEARPRPETTYVLRTGLRMQAPYASSYRLFEFSQQRGRWIYPDVGYYDIGHLRDQLWFAGVGADLYHSKRIDWTQVLYVEQEAGSAAHNQRALWVWPVLDLQITPRLSSETVVYPTIPLNRAQRWEFDVDRTKVEYLLRPRLLIGAGYSATVGAECDWKSKPFLTATTRNRSGSWEFWVQRIQDGAQLQVRYTLVKGGDDFYSTLTYSDERGWVCTLGLQSGCNLSLVEYLQGKVAGSPQEKISCKQAPTEKK